MQNIGARLTHILSLLTSACRRVPRPQCARQHKTHPPTLLSCHGTPTPTPLGHTPLIRTTVAVFVRRQADTCWWRWVWSARQERWQEGCECSGVCTCCCCCCCCCRGHTIKCSGWWWRRDAEDVFNVRVTVLNRSLLHAIQVLRMHARILVCIFARLPCRAVPCRAVVFAVLLSLHCRAVPCLTLPCLALPCRALPCLAVPCRAPHCLAVLCASRTRLSHSCHLLSLCLLPRLLAGKP
jgi:hypothetical protein